MNRTSLALCSLLATLGSALVAAGLDQTCANPAKKLRSASPVEERRNATSDGDRNPKAARSAVVPMSFIGEQPEKWLTSPAWRSIDVNRHLGMALVVPKVAPVAPAQKPAEAKIPAKAKNPDAVVGKQAKPVAAAVQPAITSRVSASRPKPRLDQNDLARLLKMVDTRASDSMNLFIAQNDGILQPNNDAIRRNHAWRNIPNVKVVSPSLPWTLAVHIGAEAGHVFDAPISGVPTRIAFDSLGRPATTPVRVAAIAPSGSSLTEWITKFAAAKAQAWKPSLAAHVTSGLQSTADLGRWIDGNIDCLAQHVRRSMPRVLVERPAAARNAQRPTSDLK